MEVFKYRLLVEARTDLTPEEIAKCEASKNKAAFRRWPWRETGDTIHAPRRSSAVAFYRALKKIAPVIKIRAVKINDARQSRRNDDVALRAWIGFKCISGIIAHAGREVGDEVKHFAVGEGLTACGLKFDGYWTAGGKPECDKCLAVAVEQHPEMKEFL